MPAETKPLCIQVQRDQPCMWAIVNPDTLKVSERIIMKGTGWEEDTDASSSYADILLLQYLGTVQIDGFVWHYFR